ncbi:hypothetical protein Tco_0139394 [Tanacetum coccineum]
MERILLLQQVSIKTLHAGPALAYPYEQLPAAHANSGLLEVEEPVSKSSKEQQQQSMELVIEKQLGLMRLLHQKRDNSFILRLINQNADNGLADDKPNADGYVHHGCVLFFRLSTYLRPTPQ